MAKLSKQNRGGKKSMEKLVEQTAKMPAETSAENLVNHLEEQSVEKPTGKNAENFAENSEEKSTKKPADNSIDKSSEKPADNSLDKSSEKLADNSLNKSTKKPADKSSEKPTDLILQLKSMFEKENKIGESNFKINGENVSVFYIESLIDKQLLCSNLIAPIEKLTQKQNQCNANQNNDKSGQIDGDAKQDITKIKQNQGQANQNNDKSGQIDGKENQSNDKLSQNNGKSSQSEDNASQSEEQSGLSTTGKAEQGVLSGGQAKQSGSSTAGQDILSLLKSEIVALSSLEIVQDTQKILEAILDGSAVVVASGGALVCPLFSPEKRAITEPPNSKVIKGPREGFVEDLAVNEGLIRKRLRTTNLKFIELVVGKQTKSKVEIVYLEGIAKAEVVNNVKKQIQDIDIDAIIDSYYIESFLEENNLKFFRRVGSTEKPDILCAKILEGRVGIMVEGSPVALTVPFMLFEDLQSSEDYYNIPAMATFARLIRIIGLIFALLAPGIYVSLQSYNYRILPINFLITLLSSIEGLSIPPLVEILIVLFLFEIITEASIRMPSSLGMALSIIGALALGNTAVDAGIISPPSIVVVAVSSVALYIIPDQISQTRILRLLFTAVGGIVGLYGIVTSFIILSVYLVTINSFSVPYLSPFAPSSKIDKKDGFVKLSVQAMKTRPEHIAGKNKTRQGGKKR